MRDPKAISLQMLLASPRNTNTSGRGFEVEAFERAFLSPMHKKVTTLKDLQREGAAQFLSRLVSERIKTSWSQCWGFFFFFSTQTQDSPILGTY